MFTANLNANRVVRVWKILLFAFIVALIPTALLADPPSWAPAHGWRAKHDSNDSNYTGYSGTTWSDDYGILVGKCNREAVGAVVGGTVGAVVGSRVAADDDKRIATFLGGVIGAAVGAKIGRDLDNADMGCVAHALELAPDNKRVSWSTEDNRVQYSLTPTRGFRQEGQPCREYMLTANANGRTQTTHGKACQASAGVWRAVANR